MYRRLDNETFRQDMISGVQSSLRVIRTILDISGQELAEYIGVTRQTINNFENERREMNIPHFLAICGLIDEMCIHNEDLKETILSVINPRLSGEHKLDIEYSLLSHWFSTFEHLREYYVDINEDNYASKMEEIVRYSDVIYIDIFFLMQELSIDFFNDISPFLEEYRKKITVSESSLEELDTYRNGSLRTPKRLAEVAYESLRELANKGLVDIIRSDFYPSGQISIFTAEIEGARKIVYEMSKKNYKNYSLWKYDKDGYLVKWNMNEIEGSEES